MTDPTEMVLTGGFAVMLAVFAISLCFKARSWRVPLARIDPHLPQHPDESPYSAPREPGDALPPPRIPAGKVPVWFYRPADLIGAGFVFLVFCGLVVASFGGQDAAVELTPPLLLVNIGFQFVMAGIVAAFVVRRVSLTTWLGLHWPTWPKVILIAPGTVLFMWTVFGGLQISGYVEWMESLGVETVQDTVKLLQESKDPVILGLMAFAAVVAAPICEEIVFRGYFYPVLKKFTGIWPAVFCSSILFASAHGSLTALLPLFIFGAVLVFIYEKTGSLWAPIAVHFCFNGATVLFQMADRFTKLPLEAAQ